VVAPVGGGGSGGSSRRAKPWVNFAAGFGPRTFTAGGKVEGAGSEQARTVRLTFADGLVVEETVDNGAVLFFEPRTVDLPAEVEVLDARGRLLARYEEFDEFTSIP
jgi:predicted ThiF/HesA family dinucleotide-utilizing enzyme